MDLVRVRVAVQSIVAEHEGREGSHFYELVVLAAVHVIDLLLDPPALLCHDLLPPRLRVRRGLARRHGGRNRGERAGATRDGVHVFTPRKELRVWSVSKEGGAKLFSLHTCNSSKAVLWARSPSAVDPPTQ